MNAIEFRCSFSPHFQPHRTRPESSFRRKRCFPSELRPGTELAHGFRLPLDRHGKKYVFRVRARNPGVKSEPYDLSTDVRDSVKFKGALKEVIVSSEEESVAWWEEFPKRWVVVVLCFSAFLLCNMDRVSSVSPIFGWLMVIS